MTGKILIAVMTILAALAAAPGFAGEWETLSEDEKRQIEGGESLCRTVARDVGEGRIEGTMQPMVKIDVSIDKSWELFTQFERHSEFLPRQTGSIVVEKTSRSVFVLKKFSFFGRKVDYMIQYSMGFFAQTPEKVYSRISWSGRVAKALSFCRSVAPGDSFATFGPTRSA